MCLVFLPYDTDSCFGTLKDKMILSCIVINCLEWFQWKNQYGHMNGMSLKGAGVRQETAVTLLFNGSSSLSGKATGKFILPNQKYMDR